MTKPIKIGLLGKGIGKSQSKNLHELLGELYGIPVTYQLMDMAGRTGQVSVRDELLRCRELGYRGMNVTHPYKREAFGEVIPPAHLPPGLASINTVLFESDGMHGDNTDFSGFCRAFRHKLGAEHRPGRVLLLGAGGVGVAIAFALCRLGASEIVIHDTCRKSADALVDLLADTCGTVRVADSDLVGEMQRASGLVNATPIGMFQYPGNPFPTAGIGNQEWAFDAVYTPEETEFLSECRQRSIILLSGFWLFLYQGLHAFSLFTGVEPDAACVKKEFSTSFPRVHSSQGCY